jgi:hypothetical protein
MAWPIRPMAHMPCIHMYMLLDVYGAKVPDYSLTWYQRGFFRRCLRHRRRAAVPERAPPSFPSARCPRARPHTVAVLVPVRAPPSSSSARRRRPHAVCLVPVLALSPSAPVRAPSSSVAAATAGDCWGCACLLQPHVSSPCWSVLLVVSSPSQLLGFLPCALN